MWAHEVFASWFALWGVGSDLSWKPFESFNSCGQKVSCSGQYVIVVRKICQFWLVIITLTRFKENVKKKALESLFQIDAEACMYLYYHVHEGRHSCTWCYKAFYNHEETEKNLILFHISPVPHISLDYKMKAGRHAVHINWNNIFTALSCNKWSIHEWPLRQNLKLMLNQCFMSF